MTPPPTQATSAALQIEHALEAIAEAWGVVEPDALAALSRASSLQRYRKGQHLLSQGDEQRFIAFAARGVIRTFHTDDAGNEITNCLIASVNIPAVPSPDFDGPALETVEALTDVEALLIDIKAFETLVATVPTIARAYHRIVAQAWRFQWDMKMMLRQKSARERYEWFLDEYPGLIDRISHRHIASFLAMTPETLARVRRGLAN